MAYINVAEWTPDQVTDWLKGLDDSMYSYVYSFTNNEVGGQQLLNIRPYELEQLGMHAIGHQEIVLEAVEILRNFHYNLDKENLQFMALHVATAARSLHRQLAVHCDASKIETEILNDITRTIATIKPLISWLYRAPFHGQPQFMEICLNMLRRGLEMATIAQRDRFADKPVEQIRETALRLENLANYIIQDISDPMLLQPASLNLVTLKKRESELGFSIEPNYHGVHRVTDIKYNSPAHNSGKIEDGDEIVQINYQTVVGWQYKTVLMQLRESLPDVLLTLKKRPKHTKIYGQIYMQPYRLPSKKRNVGTRWGENLPSPRAGFLTVPEAASAFQLPLSLKTEQKASSAACSASDTESSDSDILTPTDQKSTPQEIRLYYPKPRAMLQRRNTICGDEYLNLHNGCVSGAFPKWQERHTSGLAGEPGSPSLRDKSVSFGFGLDATLSRPKTYTGMGSIERRSNAAKIQAGNSSLEALPEERLKLGVSKVVRFDANMTSDNYKMDEKYTCNVQNTILETYEPIPFADDEEEEEEVEVSQNTRQLADAVNAPLVARRGRLDKSHSTPTYDNSADEQPVRTPPPAIEPRQANQAQMPPVPPPRPRKAKDIVVPPPPPKPLKPRLLMPADTQNLSNDSLSLPVAEVNELHTPVKSRTLTLKKKHNLIAKRRNVNLKLLGTGEIQGHLYRRTKDRRGVTFWARIYFVMLDTILYGFRSKEALKASCVIFLPGFTVSLAKEVHSKPFAFKVYHAEKTFYFAAESQAALNQWVEFIRQSTLQSTVLLTQVNVRDLFSETESSGEESESIILNNLCTPSPQAPKDIAYTQTANIANADQTPLASAKHDRRYLGSLRKLTKNTLHFKSSWSNYEKKASSDIPVPTQQFRSYRKVPGGSFGLQIGTNTPGSYYDQSFQQTHFQMTPAPTTVPLTPTNVNTNEIKDVAPALPRKMSVSNKTSNVEQITMNNTTITTTTIAVATTGTITMTTTGSMTIITTTGISTPTPTTSTPCVTSPTSTNSSRESANNSPGMRSLKKIPYNFIHASNPNLVEFDFQTSKTLDYSLPKISAGNTWDVAHASTSSSIQGFVTLKDLMLQKQQEEAQEMYNNRVLLGVEKKDVSRRLAAAENSKSQQQQQQQQQEVVVVGDKVSKTQNRSLPKTPDYEISFKPDDENIKRTRTKEGLKLRDFGYELISGDEPISSTATHSRQNSNISNYKYGGSDQQQQQQHLTKTARQFLKTQQFLLSGARNKKHSTASISSTTSSMTSASSDFSEKGRGDSFKKAFKNSSERLFQFNKHHQQQHQQQPQNMTMTLPLHKKCNSNVEEQVVGVTSAGSSIRKSHTYNHDLKDKCDKYDAQRKNSAPIFSKLNFSHASSTANFNNNNNNNNNSNSNSNNGKNAKEKKLLGSPLLHRTIFGHSQRCAANNASNASEGSFDEGEIFSQVILPKVPSNHYNEQVAIKYRLLSQTSVVSNTSEGAATVGPPLQSGKSSAASTPTSRNNSNTQTPEYPNMECPPIFEPEMYSLSDSNASLSLLLRRNNSAESSGANEKNLTTKNTHEQ